jgi:hypothetical protein
MLVDVFIGSMNTALRSTYFLPFRFQCSHNTVHEVFRIIPMEFEFQSQQMLQLVCCPPHVGEQLGRVSKGMKRARDVSQAGICDYRADIHKESRRIVLSVMFRRPDHVAELVQTCGIRDEFHEEKLPRLSNVPLLCKHLTIPALGGS